MSRHGGKALWDRCHGGGEDSLARAAEFLSWTRLLLHTSPKSGPRLVCVQGVDGGGRGGGQGEVRHGLKGISLRNGL